MPLDEAHGVVDTGRELTIRAARRGFGPKETLCRCAKEEASDIRLLSHGKSLRQLTGEVTSGSKKGCGGHVYGWLGFDSL
ncbi:MAG: hypothetical protein HY848_19735 [Betaproteobacteria bacterium]|nr:hypothetical protein [Betaproteobacteria bacterium]